MLDCVKLFEAKDVAIYKQLLRVLGDYVQKTPGTGVDKLFDAAVESGKSIMPKDKRALMILNHILYKKDTTPAIVQKLLNARFSSLPIDIRPIYKDGRKKVVAAWNRGVNTSDRIKDLIDFAGGSTGGSWADIDGNSVKLIDMTKENSDV